VVAAAYARKHADGITLELLEWFGRENASLRTSIDWSKRAHCTRTGRYVVAQTVSASILSFGLLLVLFWYGFTAEGAAFRTGVARGYQDANAIGPVRAMRVVPAPNATTSSGPGSTSTDRAHGGETKVAEVGP
jgi:hypothetical protein